MEEMDEVLMRTAEAKPTRVVSTSGGLGGSRFTALENESIEEKEFWGDYDESDDEQLYQKVESLEKQRAKEEAVVAVAAKRSTPKLRARPANEAIDVREREWAPKAKRARGSGGAGTAGETEAVGIVPNHAGWGAVSLGGKAQTVRKKKQNASTHGGATTSAVASSSKVRSSSCAEEKCNVQASFGVPGGRAIHCFKHKKPGEEDVRNPRCAEENCMSKPSYGVPGGRAIHCAKHKKPGEENVVSVRCQGCDEDIGVLTHANPKYSVGKADGEVENLCARCFRRKYPQGAFEGDERVGGRMNSREGICVHSVMNAEALKDLSWVWDKPFWFGCWEGCDSKRRVDTWAMVDGCVLGVEVDENQHKGHHYAADSEIRTNEIAMEIGMAPFYLVRLNPDSYVSKSGRRIAGFFEQKNNMTCRRQSEIDRRVNKLIDTVKTKRNEIQRLSREKSTVESYLVETFLFFDGYDDDEYDDE